MITFLKKPSDSLGASLPRHLQLLTKHYWFLVRFEVDSLTLKTLLQILSNCYLCVLAYQALNCYNIQILWQNHYLVDHFCCPKADVLSYASQQFCTWQIFCTEWFFMVNVLSFITPRYSYEFDLPVSFPLKDMQTISDVESFWRVQNNTNQVFAFSC